jgi:hypothetical protein
VRTTLSVFLPPRLDETFCFGQRPEPVGIQALSTEGSVQRFNEGVVVRLTWTGEVDLHPVLVSPQVHRLTGPIAPAMVEGAHSIGMPIFDSNNGRMMEVDGGASIIDVRLRGGERPC